MNPYAAFLLVNSQVGNDQSAPFRVPTRPEGLDLALSAAAYHLVGKAEKLVDRIAGRRGTD